jgi:hypothetical protein
MMATWIKQLVANYSIDGLRTDAFLPALFASSGVFAPDEVLTGVTEDIFRYEGMGLLQGTPNYLDWFPMMAAFYGGSIATARRNAQAASQRQSRAWPSPATPGRTYYRQTASQPCIRTRNSISRATEPSSIGSRCGRRGRLMIYRDA